MGESTPNWIGKYYRGSDVVPFCLPSQPEKSSKSITSFNKQFIKILNILNVKQVFLFSITIQVEFNAVLLVLNYLAKVHDLRVFFVRGNPQKDFC